MGIIQLGLTEGSALGGEEVCYGELCMKVCTKSLRCINDLFKLLNIFFLKYLSNVF